MFVWKPKQQHQLEVAYQCRVAAGQEVHFQLMGPDHATNQGVVALGASGDPFHIQPGIVVTVMVTYGAELKFATTLENTVNIGFSS